MPLYTLHVWCLHSNHTYAERRAQWFGYLGWWRSISRSCRMSRMNSCRRVRKKLAILLLLFAAVPVPRSSTHPQYRSPQIITSHSNVNWQRRSAIVASLMNPKCLAYLALTVLLTALVLLAMMDLFLKIVYGVCSTGVYYATYHCQLHINHSGPTVYQW